MMDYVGVECPVCGKTFTGEDEDIVVCPECGAPHHRECYTAHGECGCAEEHGTENAWDKQRKRETEARQKACPFCGNMNDENAVYCSRCERSISQNVPPYGAGNPYNSGPYGAGQGGPGRPPFGGPPFGTPPGAYGPGGVNPMDPLCGFAPDEDFDGVPAEEMIKVIRANTRYYLNVFNKIKTQGRSRFSFVALLLGSVWLFYRRQFRLGAIFLSIQLGLVIAASLVANFVTGPILNTIYSTLNITPNTQMSEVLMDKLTSEIMQLDGGQIFLFFLPMMIIALGLLMNIFLGIMANRWYFKHCVTVAKRIKTKYSIPSERDAAYRAFGGVSMGFAMGVIMLYMLCNNIPLLF